MLEDNYKIMAVNKIENEIVQEFAQFKEWEEKYSHLIKLGKSNNIDPKYQTDEYKVKGCQSSVWMFAEFRDGRVYYQADSDASIVRGLVALLLRVYSGQKPEDIMQSKGEFLEKLGLNTHLSQTRATGLASMLKQIKLYAYAFYSLNK